MEFSSEIGAVQRRMAQTQEGVGRRKATFEALNVAVGQQILDVGCGGGHLLKDLALSVGTDGRVVGLDPSDQQIAAATDYCQGLDNVSFSKDSATALSFSDGEFDGVVSIQVLEYIDDVDDTVACKTSRHLIASCLPWRSIGDRSMISSHLSFKKADK